MEVTSISTLPISLVALLVHVGGPPSRDCTNHYVRVTHFLRTLGVAFNLPKHPKLIGRNDITILGNLLPIQTVFR